MVSSKAGGLRLLQAAVLISSAAARCTPCGASDALLVLLRAQDQSEVAPFCGSVLGIQASTVDVTITPTVVASITSTVEVTEVSTVLEEVITVTVPAPPAPTSMFVPRKKAKRTAVEYPTWLASTYSPARVSSACQCLGGSATPSATTVTATAEAVTVTEEATVTETTISTLVTDAVVTVTQSAAQSTTESATQSATESTTESTTQSATESATPSSPAQNLRGMIQVVRKSTSAPVGYIYMSSGLAITSDPTLAVVVDLTVPAGATTANKLRLSPEGYSPSALGFSVVATRELRSYYGNVIVNTPTTPGSTPVVAGTTAYETDIWTIDTQTKLIGWEWVGTDGAIDSSSIVLYREGARMYAVGDVPAFTASAGGVSSSSTYEIQLRYVVV